MTNTIRGVLALAALLLVSGCLLPMGGGGDGPSGEGGEGGEGTAPQQECIVGLWSISGTVEVGACVPTTPIPVEHSFLFEQDGSEVFGRLVGGSASHELVDAAYEKNGDNCRAVFVVTARELTWTYDVTAVDNYVVYGNAMMEAVGEYACQQVYEVNGVLDKG